MKKLLALGLALMILSSGFTAFAGDIVVDSGSSGGGFGDNNVEVEDTLQDEVEAIALYFNDFENCTFTRRSGTDYSFDVVDSGEADYGKVFETVSTDNGWGAISGAVHTGTYVRNEETYPLFNETLTPNTDYIMGIKYKTIGNENFNGNAQGALSFAPQIPNSQFVFGTNGDYRYYLPLTNGWVNHAVKFNSSTATSMNVKLNVAGSSVTTWIDNYGIYEPVTLTVKGLDVELDISEGVYTDGYLGKGSSLIASAPDGMTIKSATMGGRSVVVTEGMLNISSVAGDIVVNVVSDLKSLKENFVVKNNNIYVPKGQSVANFAATALANETYTLTDSEGNPKLADGTIYPGDILTVKVSDTESETFTFKYILDSTGANEYVVSDVVYILDCLLGNKEAQPEDDLNGNGKLTVSDLVLVRHHIMTANGNYSIDKEKLATEKAKVAADAAAFGITDEMLRVSVANVGNRSRVANVMKKALRGENITIATIGGSITEGTGIPVADGRADKCWAALMADWWERMFPGQVTFVNAGISGTSSVFGNYRLTDDVLSHNPDLLYVEFAVNDGAQTGSVRSCQEAILLRAMAADCAVIQMFFTTVSYNGGGGQLTYQPLGEYYDIPQISPRDAFWGNTFSNADGNTYDFAGLTADGTHPNIMGNAMVAVLTNNYLNRVYEDLTEINATPNAVPEETFEDDTPNYMNWTSYDIGLMEEGVTSTDGKVTVTDFGDFVKNTDSTSFRSNCTPMYGVKYSSGTAQPIVLDVDDCHVFGIFSHTATNGANVKVEVYKQGTDELIKTDSSVDTNYGGALRSHKASFESLEGVDVTIKITPVIADGRTTANLRTFYIS